MKKLLFFLLSVVLIGSVGCGSNKDLSTEVTNTESTEVVNETVEPTTEAVTVETEDAGTAQQESTEAEQRWILLLIQRIPVRITNQII